MAKQHLSEENLRQIFLDDGRILDEKTSDISDALLDMNIAVPHSLLSHSKFIGTVYHIRKLIDCETLDKLYNANFRGVDGYDIAGRTPLMILDIRFGPYSKRRFECLHWFISKGASLKTPQLGHS